MIKKLWQFMGLAKKPPRTLPKTAGDLLEEMICNPVEDEEDEEYDYPPRPRGLQVVPPEQLLKKHYKLIQKIQDDSGTHWDKFQERYWPAIKRYAQYVHLLPASEIHHHRSPGGLLHHGLETAFFTLRRSINTLYGLHLTMSQRVHAEPAWKFTLFMAGMCHDIGKVASDMIVTDMKKKITWDAEGPEDIYTWATRHNLEKYLVSWCPDRHKLHSKFGPVCLSKVMTPEDVNWINGLDRDLRLGLLSVFDEHPKGKIAELVQKADMDSTEKDIKAQRVPPPMGADHRATRYEHLFRVIRELVSSGVWNVNTVGGRAWVLPQGVFLTWPQAFNDLVKALTGQTVQVPGLPGTPDEVVGALLDFGYLEKKGEALHWFVRPAVLQGQGRDVKLMALKLESGRANEIFNPMPSGVEGEAWSEADGEDQGAPAAKTTAKKEAVEKPGKVAGKKKAPAPAEAPVAVEPAQDQTQGEKTPRSRSDKGMATPPAPASVPEPVSEQPQVQVADQAQDPEDDDNPLYGPSAEEEGEDDDQVQGGPSSEAASTAPAPVDESSPPAASASDGKAEKAAEAARTFFSDQGLIGEVILSLAEDLENGKRKKGEDVARVPDGRVAIHLDALAGYGMKGTEVKKALEAAGWLDFKPGSLIPVQDMPAGNGKGYYLTDKASQKFWALMKVSQTAPVQAAPVQAAPVQATPVQATPVQAAPVQAAPVQAAPAVQGRKLPAKQGVGASEHDQEIMVGKDVHSNAPQGEEEQDVSLKEFVENHFNELIQINVILQFNETEIVCDAFGLNEYIKSSSLPASTKSRLIVSANVVLVDRVKTYKLSRT